MSHGRFKHVEVPSEVLTRVTGLYKQLLVQYLLSNSPYISKPYYAVTLHTARTAVMQADLRS
jgi:hypothetical protein